MNYEWIVKTNHLENKIWPKKSKKIKNQSEIAGCEQKITSEKGIFAQTPFSHST